MAVDNRTRNGIHKLAEVIVDSSDEDSSMFQGSWLARRIPVGTGDESAHLSLSGEAVHRYLEALVALEKDRAFEHLTRKELDAELAILSHGLVVKHEEMKSGSVRRERINRFLSALARPLVPYEVAFNVEGIKFATDPITIGEVVFREFSQELARDWDCAEVEGLSRKVLQKRLDDLTGWPVGVVTVQAGSADKAVERAQGYFDRALNTLRLSIGSCPHWLIHDIQLIQRRGRWCIARQLEPKARPVRTGWERGFRPLDTDLGGRLAESTKSFIGQLSPLYDGTIQGRLCGALLRSLQWIGTSITRENFDDKIVDLCTALEAALTTKDDPRKGEAIALRSMLLAMALDKRFPHPRDLLGLYELRSQVVHGAALGVCGESDYRGLRWRAEDAILNIIELNSTQGPIARPSHLIKLLESPERLEKAMCWLERWPGEDTKAVADYAKLRLEEQQKSNVRT